MTTNAFDDTSVDTERSADNVEDLVADYLNFLQDRFENHLSGLKECDSQHQWANFWLQEEAQLEAHHKEACMMAEKQTQIQRYLISRKERILNLLWSICRDAMDQPVQHAFASFVEREEQLMKLYLVGYIQSAVQY